MLQIRLTALAQAFAAVLTAMSTAVLTGCGGSPPGSEVTKQIEHAVLTANTVMFEATPETAEVVAIEIAGWKKDDLGPGVVGYGSDWTAKLRFKEPIACVNVQVDGTKVVSVIAEKGYELPFTGHVGGIKHEGNWSVNASAKSDLTGPGAWKPLWEKAGPPTAGYQVITQGRAGNPAFRVHNFEPLSKLKPYVIEGSPEAQKFAAEIGERQKKALEAAAEQARQRKAALEAQQAKAREDQANLQAAAVEKQRLAREEQQRLQAEAADKQRAAQEEAKKKLEEQRHARLLAVLKPFQSATGAVITAEAGTQMGTVILDATIDDRKLTVTGHAIDLREMPFREFTYEGAVADSGAFTFKSSAGGEPVAYGATGDKLVSRAGLTIAAMTDADRAKSDALVNLGKRLGSASAAAIKVETSDANEAKSREAQLQLSGLTGTVLFRGKVNPGVAPLFAGDLKANKAYAWKNKEVVAIRLNDPVKCSGLYLRGAAAACENVIVTINGVHQAIIAAVPKLGGAMLTLLADTEVLDIRIEATGTVQSRTIGLLK